jgi:hypothetical protein
VQADRNYARKMKKAAKRQRQKDRERTAKAVEKYVDHLDGLFFSRRVWARPFPRLPLTALIKIILVLKIFMGSFAVFPFTVLSHY